MSIDIDIAIFITFLAANLIIGFFAGTKTSNMAEYAIGGRSFSTGALASTIIATAISGGLFYVIINNIYQQGLNFLPSVLGHCLHIFLMAYFLCPRMQEFLGTISVAESMGNLYGKKIRMITAICGFISAAGLIAVQFQVSSKVFGYFLKIGPNMATIASATVVIAYSAFGGIKAVTFTDIFQFLVFGTIVPILSIIMWNSIENHEVVWNLLTHNPSFDFGYVFSLENPKLLSSLTIGLYYFIPGLNPAMFQRVVMSKNLDQAKKAFLLAAIFCLLIELCIAWLAVLLLAINPNIPPETLLPYIIDQHSYTGLKGLTLIGITAMIMSTADSYINSASVLFIHDFCGPLGIKPKNQLLWTRAFAIFVGVSAMGLALIKANVLKIVLVTASFYMPIVTGPLILAILGFRTTPLIVYISMVAGFTTVILWLLLGIADILHVEAVMPAMAINIVVLLTSHYILRQPGGWVGIKNDQYLKHTRYERKRKLEYFVDSIRNFNFLDFCHQNAPLREGNYVSFGLFSLISVSSLLFSLPEDVKNFTEYSGLLKLIYNSVLILSTLFLTYPIWPQTIKNAKNFVVVAWNFALPYTMIFVATLSVIISRFDMFPLMVLMVNLIIVSLLLRWRVALFYIITGTFMTGVVFKLYTGDNIFYGYEHHYEDTKFEIMYVLLAISSTLVALIKPNQQAEETNLSYSKHLEEDLKHKDKQLFQAASLKNEILNNISHEIRTPVHIITNLARGLTKNWDQLKEDKKYYYNHQIANYSNKLLLLIDQILDFSALSINNLELKAEWINLIQLVEQTIQECKDLYIGDKTIEVIFDIKTSVLNVEADSIKLGLVIRNILTNAIKYSPHGTILVTLMPVDMQDNVNLTLRTRPAVQISIKDHGLGIPNDELEYIFYPFTRSCRTKHIPSSGLGLSISKKIIEAHKGKVWVENNQGEPGATFHFIIPITIKKE